MKNGIFHPSVISKRGFLWLHSVIIKKALTIFTEKNASWMSLRSYLVLSSVSKSGWGNRGRKNLIFEHFYAQIT